MKQIKVIFLLIITTLTAHGQCPSSIKVNDTFSINIIIPVINGVKIVKLSYYEYKTLPAKRLDNDTLYLNNTTNSNKDTVYGVDSLFYSDTSVNFNNWKLTGVLSNGYYYNCNVALPVELVYFKAKHVNNEEVKLKWKTASETNNHYFEVQRNINREWITIARIKGSGTSYTSSYYNYTVSPNHKVTYYRLKQVDYDGDCRYSDVISVDKRTENNNKVIYLFTPNNRIKIINGEKIIKLR